LYFTVNTTNKEYELSYTDDGCDELFVGTSKGITIRENIWRFTATVIAVIPLLISVVLSLLFGGESFLLWCIFYGGPLLFIESWNSVGLIVLQFSAAIVTQIFALAAIFRSPTREASILVTIFLVIWYLLGVAGTFHILSQLGDIGP